MGEGMHLILLAEVAKALGVARPTLRDHQRAGLIPEPVWVNSRKKALPSNEVAALVGARMAGMSDDQVRELVTQLMAQRQQVAAELLGAGS